MDAPERAAIGSCGPASVRYPFNRGRGQPRAGGERDERTIKLVAEVGRPVRAELVGVHVVEIEWSLPLDADIAARSEEVQQVLDHAELVAHAGGRGRDKPSHVACQKLYRTQDRA